ncbi:MAG TPA: hypothetical protein VGJ91_10235 [Polyangiaceae bacterium]
MVGAFARAFAVVCLGLGVGCAAPQEGQQAAATVTTREPVYRFVSRGITSPMNQQALEGGRIGVITDGEPGREIVNPDGSVELAQAGAGERLMGGVPVPARLGGGYLFWENALYHAPSFTGPLEAIAALPTNAIGVEFGPDYLLLLAPDSSPRAFGLGPPRALQLSPKGVIDVAATDDGRALALDAVGRALASTDGGQSWQNVTTALGGPAAGVRSEGNEVAFAVKHMGAWLGKDGRFTVGPFGPDLPGKDKTAELQIRALSDGLPLPGTRAWIGDGRNTVALDLRSGSVSQAVETGPKGSNCVPVSLDEEGLVVCVNYAHDQTATVISHALGAAPVSEKTFVGAPRFMTGRALTVLSSCAGVQAEGAACVRRSGGAWADVKASADVLKMWQPLYWLPRESGGVDLLVSERPGRVGEPKVALLDPATNRLTVWDTTLAQITPSQASRREPSLSVLADGSVRGFVKFGTIAVDPRGHVTVGARTFASVSSAGAHALARDRNEHLWQTSDYGEHWLEIEPPPFDAAPEGMAAKEDPRPSGRATHIDCSLTGCALEHSSGTGSWLRLGWPEDPAREPAGASPPAARVSGVPPRITAALPGSPAPALPQLRCRARIGGPLHPTTPVQPPPEASSEWLQVLAGKRALARRPPHTLINLAYRDVFSLEELSLGYGLRAAVHLDAAEGTALSELSVKKTPLDLLFVEPFDPSGSVHQMRARPPDWLSLDAPSARAGAPQPANPGPSEEPELAKFGGSARPLLSSDPGRAGGLLLVNGALSLWASSTGKVQRLRRGCVAVSGYVDARGQRFVACKERNASTRLEALGTPPHEFLRAPAAAHFRERTSPGLTFLAPGEPVFLNPDAIAVGRDGTLRILRLPPGASPPTSDNPAWLLSADDAPLELAPWSTLELASSSVCTGGDGYRAIVQTGATWLELPGATSEGTAGMTALVRWSAERVCLEAVEVGFSSLKLSEKQRMQVSAVARFVGAQSGAAFVGTEGSAALREPASCELAIAATVGP